MQGQRVAIIAAPTPRFLEVGAEGWSTISSFPSPTIGGAWSKLSMDARTSYLFTDLTEANARRDNSLCENGWLPLHPHILQHLVHVARVVPNQSCKSFPHGEAGLKSVIDKCHAAGLKVGMHMLTSFVGKNDPLVRPKPNPGLLKDGEATLATDMTEVATQLTATSASAPAGFPLQAGSYDIVIDDEIVHCRPDRGRQVSPMRARVCGDKARSRTRPGRRSNTWSSGTVHTWRICDRRSRGTISDRVAGADQPRRLRHDLFRRRGTE